MNKESDLQSRLFFIIGRGRSGVTLLRSLLDTHPRVSVTFHTVYFIMNLYKRYARAKWTREKILSFYDDLWLEESLANWRLDKDKLRQDLLACEGRASFPELCKVVFANYATVHGKEGCIILGDKNPLYSLFVRELISVFPDAKFIHVVRDYRDTILSYQGVKFDANNTSALAYRWKKYNEEILKNSKRWPEKFAILRYEDLLENTERELERICSFLEIDFDPVMLNFYKNQKDVPEWHRNITKPLNESHLCLWKNEMERGDVIKSDYVCRDLSKYFGYEGASGKGSPFLFIATLPGVLYGSLITWLEKFIFFLPLRLRATIINYYRTVTGSLRRKIFTPRSFGQERGE